LAPWRQTRRPLWCAGKGGRRRPALDLRVDNRTPVFSRP
jgi:hypothetical protein